MEQSSQSFTHKQLAVSCFNKVWDFLDKEVRTEDEDEQMVHLSHSSFWHWGQVEDHTQQNISIGYWQLARVYAVIGRGETALHYANRCISVSVASELAPFYIGYAYEAAARWYAVLGRQDEVDAAKERAMEFVEKVVVEDSKTMLVNDLETI
ncbi:hypothetical protein RCG23_16545 [Neobacillus sp. PS3-34]|uniref:hypothetical protein n=1 Tax=Neobacillus sp. PS3-34 TaxID=3070678 RepID=UPI0027E11C48|nr:hypothetical protein [Neobacillus sp. PS3-34]WML47169.1 hypothetical protein RCG23_16545 [Neobacillus sp. PS3-34]